MTSMFVEKPEKMFAHSLYMLIAKKAYNMFITSKTMMTLGVTLN